MKKIINNKMYNTETATHIESISYGRNRRDYSYYEESLYRKKTGEFFLYGSGGPASKYRKEVAPHSWESGEDIIPVTLEEVKRWCEMYISPDYYEEVFGPVEE